MANDKRTMGETKLIRAIPFCILFAMSFFNSCKKDVCLLSPNSDLSADVNHVNASLRNLHALIVEHNRDGRIVTFNIHDDDYELFFDDGVSISIDQDESIPQSGYPDLTVEERNGIYYWRATSPSGSILVPINEDSFIPYVTYIDNTWRCAFDISSKSIELTNSTIGLFSDFELFSQDDKAKMFFPSGSQVGVSWSESVYIVNDIIPNQSFYKDLFFDAGYGLKSRNTLAAISYLHLSMEFMNFNDSSEIPLQNRIIGGDDNDVNGRLLYPDGQPRYKALFVEGGKSTRHGSSLTDRSLDNMRFFNSQGGSYIGTCAGAFFASTGYNDSTLYSHYLGIWPMTVTGTHLLNSKVSFRMEANSPLCDYCNFSTDTIIPDISHNGGCYPRILFDGAEILAYINSSELSSYVGKPAIWSYKKEISSGRMVLSGSHPEVKTSGICRELTAAMIRYAIDGRGTAKIKGFLKNGQWRNMNKSTEDNNPNYTKIGDLQYHHFVVYIPQSAYNITFRLSSTSSCDMQLMLSRATIPYQNNAEYVSDEQGSNQMLQFLTLDPGIWYVSVRCNTTVSVITETWGQSYSGNLETLNGVPYRILVSWDNVASHKKI